MYAWYAKIVAAVNTIALPMSLGWLMKVLLRYFVVVIHLIAASRYNVFAIQPALSVIAFTGVVTHDFALEVIFDKMLGAVDCTGSFSMHVAGATVNRTESNAIRDMFIENPSL